LSDERLILILRETQRAVTPFGGIAVFISFLGKIGFVEALRRHMPICWKSPNHIDPSSTCQGRSESFPLRRSKRGPRWRDAERRTQSG
jgi:hypothetical protein